jgi:hypothetical protein
MPKVVVNIPRKKWIGRGWVFLTLLMAVIFTTIYLFVLPLGSNGVRMLLPALFVVLELLLVVITVAYYRTRYVIRNGVLRSWSPFMTINLPLKDIRRVERTRVPVHLRVGASVYCGIFFIPGVGWTRTIITNMTDGLIIYAKDGKNYLITPSDPDRFAKLLKR